MEPWVKEPGTGWWRSGSLEVAASSHLRPVAGVPRDGKPGTATRFAEAIERAPNKGVRTWVGALGGATAQAGFVERATVQHQHQQRVCYSTRCLLAGPTSCSTAGTQRWSQGGVPLAQQREPAGLSGDQRPAAQVGTARVPKDPEEPEVINGHLLEGDGFFVLLLQCKVRMA